MLAQCALSTFSQAYSFQLISLTSLAVNRQVLWRKSLLSWLTRCAIHLEAWHFLPVCWRMPPRKCWRLASGSLIYKRGFERFPPRSKEEASCIPFSVAAFARSSPRPLSRANIVLASRVASSKGTNNVSGSPNVLVYSFCGKPMISMPAEPPFALWPERAADVFAPEADDSGFEIPIPRALRDRRNPRSAQLPRARFSLQT